MRTALVACLALASCITPEPMPPDETAMEPPVAVAPDGEDVAAVAEEPVSGRSILVAGQLVSVGASVVLFSDPDGYSAYSEAPRFGGDREGLRYQPGRVLSAGGRDRAPTPDELKEVVDLFVIHYDVAGTSRRCFEVLHDLRGLSVHFLLDVDGTIYQTLDPADTAWHASKQNARSIGIEVAQIGAYPPDESGVLSRWYRSDSGGTRIELPASYGDGGVRTRGFVARPRSPVLERGTIHGRELVQYDFTAEQYDSLARLTAALVRTFPRIGPDVPRDSNGRVLATALDAEALGRFSGLAGHWHTDMRKIDPGPAFGWESLLLRVRTLLAIRP